MPNSHRWVEVYRIRVECGFVLYGIIEPAYIHVGVNASVNEELDSLLDEANDVLDTLEELALGGWLHDCLNSCPQANQLRVRMVTVRL